MSMVPSDSESNDLMDFANLINRSSLAKRNTPQVWRHVNKEVGLGGHVNNEMKQLSSSCIIVIHYRSTSGSIFHGLVTSFGRLESDAHSPKTKLRAILFAMKHCTWFGL